MKVVIVGAGNTGTVLGHLIQSSGHHILQVVSRSAESAQRLAGRLAVPYGTLEDEAYAEADIYILCLADHAMNSIENIRALRGKFIVHTAGSLSINTLQPYTHSYGVLYPLQTLSRFVSRMPEIPLLVDGNNEQTLAATLDFARSLSPIVTRADDHQRMSYHVAAVFAANFANHMFALSELFCQKEKLDFKHLHPLINEVNNRINQYSPFLTQTGPAIRNDVFTITKHLNILNEFHDLKYMYLKLTENILKVHGKR